jgi:hypothetical protein
MNYLSPFKAVRRRLNISGTNEKERVTMSYAEFEALIRLLLRAVKFDDDWYLKQYPDVEEAVRKGTYKSAQHHFIAEGYFEGRRPCEMEIDESWYLKSNPDVAAGIRTGRIPSAKEHFSEHGYVEGRLPFEF